MTMVVTHFEKQASYEGDKASSDGCGVFYILRARSLGEDRMLVYAQNWISAYDEPQILETVKIDERTAQFEKLFITIENSMTA